MPIKFSLRISLSDAAFNELQCNSHIRKFSVKHLNQGIKNYLILGDISTLIEILATKLVNLSKFYLSSLYVWKKVGCAFYNSQACTYISLCQIIFLACHRKDTVFLKYEVSEISRKCRETRYLLLILKRQTHKLLFHFCFFVGV